MNSELYKVDITVPLPEHWIAERDYLMSQAVPYMILGSTIGSYVGIFANTTQPVAIDPSELSVLDLHAMRRHYLQEYWSECLEEDWRFQVHDEFMASRDNLDERGSHLINYYDNTNPVSGTKGNVRFVFSDRDTAMLFRLAWMN